MTRGGEQAAIILAVHLMNALAGETGTQILA